MVCGLSVYHIAYVEHINLLLLIKQACTDISAAVGGLQGVHLNVLFGTTFFKCVTSSFVYIYMHYGGTTKHPQRTLTYPKYNEIVIFLIIK